MANGLKFSPRKTALALAVAVVCAWQSPVFAHGSEAHMVPLDKTLQEFGADVQWDDYAQMFTLIKDGAYVKVKPGAKTAIVNGKSLDLPVPVVMKEGKAWVSDTFINDVFQSGLDQTFQVEKRPHPLNSLSAAEISEAVTIVKAAPEFQPNTRFTEISLHEPDKAAVWAFALQGTPVDAPRTADVVMLDGKHVIEAVVDLQNKKILSWTPIKGAHGMVLLDDFVSVQNIINTSSEFAEVLKKHGITDPGKVVTTPLTVGFFDGKDGLQQDARLLKVVSYLDTGDGNYWAHPIENLVAVVDLEAKKIIKIEEGPVIPVPMEPRPYDGRDRNAPAVKPLDITEPEGKNYTITGDTIHWQNWDFHLRLNSRVGPILSTVTYNDNGTKRQVMYAWATRPRRLYAAKPRRRMRCCWMKPSPTTPARRPPSRTPSPYSSATPGRNISTWRWASPTSVPSAGSWWCAGSAPSATTTISLTGCSTTTAPSVSMLAPPALKR